MDAANNATTDGVAFPRWWADASVQCDEPRCLFLFLGWILVYIWLLIFILVSVAFLVALLVQGVATCVALLLRDRRANARGQKTARPVAADRTLPSCLV